MPKSHNYHRSDKSYKGEVPGALRVYLSILEAIQLPANSMIMYNYKAPVKTKTVGREKKSNTIAYYRDNKWVSSHVDSN